MSPALLIVVCSTLGFATFGPGGRFQLECSKDDFGMRSHGIIETTGPNQTKSYPLPQSTAEEYLRLRPQDAAVNAFTPEQYEREEVIGPYQIEADRVWFGKHYYDGEGMKGVGAFGYFLFSTRRYTLFSPPEVARYEISAILVKRTEVWLGLDRFGEDISTTPGGLLRWNRATHTVQRYSLEFVIDSMRVEGEWLRLKTRYGYALFRDGEVRRFLHDGRQVAKFPPPPSHY